MFIPFERSLYILNPKATLPLSDHAGHEDLVIFALKLKMRHGKTISTLPVFTQICEIVQRKYVK